MFSASFQVFMGKLFAEIITFRHIPAIPAAHPGLGAGTAPGRLGVKKKLGALDECWK